MEQRLDKIRKKINLAAGLLLTIECILILCSCRFSPCRYVAVVLLIIISILYVAVQEVIKQAVRQYTEHVIMLIDTMIDGGDISKQSADEDTLISKCVHRLLKLNAITVGERSMSRADRTKMKELISDVSHQVRIPLTNVRMLYETMNRPEITEVKRSELQTLLLQQLDKIEFLMQSLIKASRLENGVISINAGEYAVCDTIAKALGNVVISAERKDITIVVECPNDIIVKHDVKWTSEALFNILDNAVKYTPAGGCIRIEAKRQEIYTRINISDTGIGISPEHYNDISGDFTGKVR